MEFFNNFIFTDLYFRICTLLWFAFALLSFIAFVIQKIVWRIKLRKYNEEMLHFAKSIGGIPTFSMYCTMQLLSAFQEERRKLGLEALLEARRISAEYHNPEGIVFRDEQRQLSEEDLIALKNLRHACRHQTVCDAERVVYHLEEFEDKPDEV